MLRLGLAMLSFALLAGCSSPQDDTAEHHPAGQTITIRGFSFEPSSLTLTQGDRVHVHNAGSTAHTLTLDSGERDTGRIAPGATADFALPTTGRHDYHCAIHPEMAGSITVRTA